jgi:hypothetical protein
MMNKWEIGAILKQLAEDLAFDRLLALTEDSGAKEDKLHE